MRDVLKIPTAEILPSTRDVLVQQGLPAETAGGVIAEIADDACREMQTLIAPRGLLAEISGPTFTDIYPGRGENAARTPLADIHPRAERLALFAVTAGPAVSPRIAQLFAAHDYPLAAALDAAASLAADNAAAWIQDRFAARCAPDLGVLRYSPGYCGWHVSGQIKLFAELDPGEIGITLGESCLMDPLKSVSGVIVAGAPSIHDFICDFNFCTDCADHQCRDRIAHVLSPADKET